MNKQNQPKEQVKKPYTKPKMIKFGDVRHLTKAGLASGKEGSGVGNGVRRV